MHLADALKIIQQHADSNAPSCPVLLACGSNPLHLQRFLHAHLQMLLPARCVKVLVGLYGDLRGTLSRLTEAPPEMVALLIEWPDLDPRLGFRSLGGWGVRELPDFVRSVELSLGNLREILAGAPKNVQVALSLPTLPLPPVFYTLEHQLAKDEQHLAKLVEEFASWAVSRFRVVSRQHLEQVSDPAQRFDFKGELEAGIPYTLLHADRLAGCLARLLVPMPPKKGLITDLDDTLWAGIAGEIGAQSVTWDLAGHAQVHGLYQQMLRALAEQGALLAVASRNAPDVVDEVFRRGDMLLPKDCVFPVEVHWGAKSESVARILQTWNIAACDVVFVDDSGNELAEVQRAFPEMECILFPGRDYAAALNLLYRLRALFAKEQIVEEDTLRRESLRAANTARNEIQGAGGYEDFLRDSRPQLTFDLLSGADSSRALELVNKTNQFNLNGTRFTEAEWHKALQAPGAFSVTASYSDKYGPLGTIAVLRGTVQERNLEVATWVMSCRAFGRRIEDQCLRLLFDHFGIEDTVLHFSPTPRNAPLQEFFCAIVGETPAAAFKISKSLFQAKCPPLYHEVAIRS